MSGRVVGVDIGGTATRAVEFDDRLTTVDSRAAPTPRGAAAISDLVVRLVAELADGGSGRVGRVAIGMPGHVDAARGVVAAAVNLGIAAPVPIAGMLTERLGVPVHVENDGNAAALGMFAHLGLEPSASLAYVNVGTGLAAGFVLAGQLWRGVTGSAGEVGHVPMWRDGPRCACGQLGCAEAVGSGRAVAADATRRHHVIAATAWAVQLCVMTLDVDVVAVGGGMTSSGDGFGPALVDELRVRASSSPMLAAVDLASRIVMAPADVPLGSLGAVLALAEGENEGAVWRS